jgi:hypothetical protein
MSTLTELIIPSGIPVHPTIVVTFPSRLSDILEAKRAFRSMNLSKMMMKTEYVCRVTITAQEKSAPVLELCVNPHNDQTNVTDVVRKYLDGQRMRVVRFGTTNQYYVEVWRSETVRDTFYGTLPNDEQFLLFNADWSGRNVFKFECASNESGAKAVGRFLARQKGFEIPLELVTCETSVSRFTNALPIPTLEIKRIYESDDVRITSAAKAPAQVASNIRWDIEEIGDSYVTFKEHKDGVLVSKIQLSSSPLLPTLAAWEAVLNKDDNTADLLSAYFGTPVEVTPAVSRSGTAVPATHETKAVSPLPLPLPWSSSATTNVASTTKPVAQPSLAAATVDASQARADAKREWLDNDAADDEEYDKDVGKQEDVTTKTQVITSASKAPLSAKVSRWDPVPVRFDAEAKLPYPLSIATQINPDKVHTTVRQGQTVVITPDNILRVFGGSVEPSAFFGISADAASSSSKSKGTKGKSVAAAPSSSSSSLSIPTRRAPLDFVRRLARVNNKWFVHVTYDQASHERCVDCQGKLFGFPPFGKKWYHGTLVIQSAPKPAS